MRHHPTDDRTPAEAQGPSPDDSNKEKSRKRRLSLAGIGRSALLIAAVLIAAGLLYSFVQRAFISPPVEPEVEIDGKIRVIQLDVLNGSGTAKIAQRFTHYLRSRGFDVVEMGNFKDSNVELTQVIDRSGNVLAAEQVAAALGLPKERVRQQIDPHAYLDVTVIIGKDFRSLRPMQ
jgi:hypothetical protein